MRTYLTTRESAVRLNFGAGANVQDPNSGVRIAWVGTRLGGIRKSPRPIYYLVTRHASSISATQTALH